MDAMVPVKVVPEEACTGREKVVKTVVVATEVQEVVFELPRPVARDPVFDSRTDHPAGPRVIVVSEESRVARVTDQAVVPEPHVEAGIGKGGATLNIEQPVAGRASRHAEARGDGRDPVAAMAAPEQVIAHAIQSEEAASFVIVMVDPGSLALDTPHDRADLVIEANLAAGEEATVVIAVIAAFEANEPSRSSDTSIVEPMVAISVPKSAADMGADIESVPVVHDRSGRRRRGLPRQVRCLHGTCEHHARARDYSKQHFLHGSPHRVRGFAFPSRVQVIFPLLKLFVSDYCSAATLVENTPVFPRKR
jgi:hypothetical protein